MAASGRLMKKIQRHDSESTRKPPTSGPTTLDTANTPVK